MLYELCLCPFLLLPLFSSRLSPIPFGPLTLTHLPPPLPPCPPSPLPPPSHSPLFPSETPFVWLLLTHGLRRTFLASTGKGAPARIGDGGASWRLKALARAKQQASDASDPNFGRRVGDIVSEQWGSLAELTAGLTDSRAAHGMTE